MNEFNSVIFYDGVNELHIDLRVLRDKLMFRYYHANDEM